MLFGKKHSLDEAEYFAALRKLGFTLDGQIVDSVPLAPPIGYKKQPSMVELVRNMVRSERLKAELDADTESFEDADDFEIPDDPDPPLSGYENELDPPIRELVQAGEAEVKKREKVDAPLVPQPAPPVAPKLGGEGGAPPSDNPAG